MAFRVDILDSNDNQVGDGPLTHIERVTIRRSLDRIGGAELIAQGTDPRTVEVGAGRKYRIYHSQHGALGTYLHDEQSLSIASDQPKLRIKASDTLKELVHKNCYFRRNFDNVAVDTVVASLIGLVTNWTRGAIETGIGNTIVSYEGESVFEALDVLRDRWGRHFRLAAPQQLDFGEFGVDSGVRLIRAEEAPNELYGNPEIALITNLEILTEAETVVNRVIPVGAGVGETQLTLENVTSTDTGYSVQTGVNDDGSNFYYIEDTTSQGVYGTVERTVERSDIRPLSNSLANIQNAANVLYRAGLTTLLKLKDPRTHYKVEVTQFDPSLVSVGDTVNLFYRGIATAEGRPYKWVDVDEDLYILDIDETYDATGHQSVALTVGTSADRRTQDEDIMSRLLRDAKVSKVHVQPNLTHSPVNGLGRLGASNNVTFEVRIQDEVLAVNRVLMRFKTRPLRSSVTTSGAGSSHTHDTTISLGGSHTHTTDINRELASVQGPNDYAVYVNVSDDDLNFYTNDSGASAHAVSSSSDSHTHAAETSTGESAHTHGMTYGFFNDTVHPQVISVTINGTDRTTALGGTWAPTNAAVSVEVDITQYINRNTTNTILFSCTTGQGEIEFLADCLLTIQAIAV